MKEITYKFEKKRIVFTAGDEVFYIPRDKFQDLISERGVADRFERELTADDFCDDLNNRDSVALYTWLTKQKFDEATVASAIGITLQKFKTWTTEHAAVIKQIRETEASNIRAIMARYDQERPEGLRRVQNGS